MIMDKVIDYNQMTDSNMMEGQSEKIITWKKLITAIPPKRAPGQFEDCAEMISASGEVGIRVMMELCQCVLYEKQMPDEWQKV